jgi:hypothetical protein
MLSGHALAKDLQWQVYGDLGAIYQTNPSKVSSGEEADTKIRAVAGGILTNTTATTDLDLNYRAMHETWLDDTFTDRDTLEGYGSFNWKPSDYFSVFVNNRRRDLIVNERVASTQDNRTVRGTTEIGALFTARLGQVDTLNFAPVYRMVNYSNGEGVDSNRPGVVAFWEHRLSKTDKASVNLFAERIDFEADEVQNDIDRAQAFLGYAATLNRLSYDINAGYTWVKVDTSNSPSGEIPLEDQFSGPLLRALVRYDYQNHLFSLRAVRDLTDTSIGLDDSAFGGDAGYQPGDSSVNQLALVTRTQLDLTYDLRFAAEQWNLQTGYRYDRQAVEATPSAIPLSLARDETRNWLYGSLDYAMTSKINAKIGATYKAIDFTDSPFGRKDDEYRLGLVFTFQIFKYGYLQAGGLHERRDTNVDFFNSYTDNMVFLNLKLVYPQQQPSRGGYRGNYGEDIGRGFGF